MVEILGSSSPTTQPHASTTTHVADTDVYSRCFSLTLTYCRCLLSFHLSPLQFAFGTELYCSDHRYYVENVAELELTPGSWRCRGCGTLAASTPVTLEYRPTAAELLLRFDLPQTTKVRATRGHATAGIPVSIPAMEEIMTIAADGVTVRGIVLAEAAGPCCRDTACDADVAAMASGAISVSNAWNVTIINVTVSNVGGAGVRAVGAPGLRITRAAVLDVGASGIFVLTSADARVNNSIVRGFGLRHRGGPGVRLASSLDGRVDHNDISQGSFNGLSGGGPDDTGAGSSFDSNLGFTATGGLASMRSATTGGST